MGKHSDRPCLIVVAVIEAYQQALSGAPKVSAVLPRLDGMWNFVPLILLILAGVFWVIGHVPKRHSTALQRESIASVPPLSSLRYKPPTAPIPSFSKNIPVLHSAKVLANASPAQLSALYQNHTTFDADKLAEAYIDTWVSISGTVYNVRVESTGEAALSVDGVEGVLLIYCVFAKEAKKQVSVYKKGVPVNIIGRINKIDRSSVSLVECEFL
jgi:hypothetical protein